VPVVGEDDHYPKTRNGSPATPKFTIHAEKCPNRRGIEAILMEFEHQMLAFDSVIAEMTSGAVKTVILTGGYPAPWLQPSEIEALTRPELVVLIDILASPATANADYVLPSAAWAEKEGSYVNHKGLLQMTERAVRAPGHARPEGRTFWELAGRPRMYHAGDVLRELGKEIPYFAGCAEREIPEHGVLLAECEV
jgi:NADH-quinone oxidoreductase subunit G